MQKQISEDLKLEHGKYSASEEDWIYEALSCLYDTKKDNIKYIHHFDTFQFHLDDLDYDTLYNKAYKEAIGISRNDKRPLKKIIKNCIYGIAAEQYLIEKKKFRNDPRIYHDVIDREGNSVEIKVTCNIKNIKNVIERCNVKKKQYKDFSSIVYIFVSEVDSFFYKLHEIVEWNETDNIFISHLL